MNYFEVIIDAATGQKTVRPFTEEEIAALEAASRPTVTEYRSAIGAHVEATAQARQYDNAASCASYVSSTNPQWAAEAAAFIAWRDLVWAQALGLLAQVQAGAITPPSVDAVLAGLPEMNWPA